jgi:hypothetical protein
MTLEGMIVGASEASTIILVGMISEPTITVGAGALTTTPPGTTW